MNDQNERPKTVLLESELTGVFVDRVNINGELVEMKVWKYQKSDMRYESALNECDVRIIWGA